MTAKILVVLYGHGIAYRQWVVMMRWLCLIHGWLSHNHRFRHRPLPQSFPEVEPRCGLQRLAFPQG